MMEELVLQFLAFSVGLSAIALLAMLVLVKAHPRFQSAIFTVIVIGFLLPLIPAVHHLAFAVSESLDEGSGAPPGVAAISSHGQSYTFDAPNSWRGWLKDLRMVWFVGSGIAAIIVLIQVLRLLAVINRAEPISPQLMQTIVNGMSADIIASGLPPLLESSDVHSPCCTGILRPVILLPRETDQDHFRPDDIRMMLRHEMAHIRNNDLIVLAIQRLAQIIHWWNPVVHLASRRLTALQETLCDLSVSNTEGSDQYAKFLLNAGKHWQKGPKLTLEASSTFISLKRRIERVLSHDTLTECHRGIRWAALALQSGAVGALGLVTSGIGFNDFSGIGFNDSQRASYQRDSYRYQIGEEERWIHFGLERIPESQFRSYVQLHTINIDSEQDQSPIIPSADDPTTPRRQIEELYKASPAIYESVPEVRRLLPANTLKSFH